MKSLTNKVDQLFSEWDKPDSPGAALCIIKDGNIIYKRGYGSANLDYNIPITPESVFYLASDSKKFTAACILLLAQRGQISLDDDIRKYIPEIPEYESTIMIRHLIHHTSGLRDYAVLMELAGKNLEDFSNENAIKILSRQKALNFKPGEEYLYSNSGYIVMAEIVERVSGKSLREFAGENIFRPLGMRNTFFDDDCSMVVKNRVVSYGPKEGGGFQSYIKNYNAVGDGGLLSTVEDLYLWDQNFYDNKLGDSEFIEQMLTRGKLNNSKELNYAFGLIHGEYKGLKTVGHGGGMLGFRTTMIRFPQQKFTVICLCNLCTMAPDRLALQIADIYLADQFKLEEFAGDYINDELQVTYKLLVEEGNLFFRHKNVPESPLEPVGSDLFRVSKIEVHRRRDIEIHFIRDEQNEITGFTLNAGRVRNLRFLRV
ncbi:beta-lactamase family protein [Candidatus Poribacteria bacterium]|nr:beta-lactamase family protein [Candidatus Poribacteria bacterium]